MNKYWRYLLFAIGVFIPALSLRAQEDACNPQPSPEDLILPMPGGLSMVFRPVWLDSGDGPFAVREFIMGSRAGQDFRETPTKVQLGGSFKGEKGGKKQWLYYIGKYEVTVAQFSAATSTSHPGDGKLPMVDVDWFQVQDFINRYNSWLLKNAKEKVPMLDGKPGFVRLPTEQEWEFAARGGTAVDANRFDQQIPYEGDLARFEWFAGARSSHNKLKAIGLLTPNSLGIHDMLGNCSEMVHQLYQVEYTQGRVGGISLRGGNFRTDEIEMSSSLRVEQPLYGEDLQPARSDSTGFRLVLSAPVITSIVASRNMREAWVQYAKSRSVPMPAALNTAPVAEQTNVQLADTDRILKELETELEGNGTKTGNATTRGNIAKAKIALLRSSFGNIQAGIMRSEKQFAEAGVLLTSISSTAITTSLKKSALLKEFLAKMDSPEDRVALTEEQKNLADAVGRYETGLRLLIQVSPEVVDGAYEDWIKQLEGRGSPLQQKATQKARDHFHQFAKSKRLSMDAWIEEFTALKLGETP